MLARLLSLPNIDLHPLHAQSHPRYFQIPSRTNSFIKNDSTEWGGTHRESESLPFDAILYPRLLHDSFLVMLNACSTGLVMGHMCSEALVEHGLNHLRYSLAVLVVRVLIYCVTYKELKELNCITKMSFTLLNSCYRLFKVGESKRTSVDW